MKLSNLSRHGAALAVIAFLVCGCSVTFGAVIFSQTNLTSDIPGLAAFTDPNLKNPWGVSFSPTSPFWVSDQVTSKSTLYNASGAPQALVVNIPTTASGPQGPTGQVFNPTPGFVIGTGAPAAFIFSTLSGNIDAWNAAQGTTAAVVHATPGAVYTGLALANNRLFAANKATGGIDVFDSSFNPVSLSMAFSNSAAGVPAGMTPYNIQNVNGNLWVEYSGPRGTPGGFVAAFDANGQFLQRINDPHLNEPWGIVMAPPGFGDFGGDLLVGNLHDGMINAFNPSTGAFVGTLMKSAGQPFAEPGLWALAFRDTSMPNANTGNSPNTLFFVSGINDENNGLFGKLDPVPEPSTVILLGLGLGLMALRRRRNHSSHLRS